MKNTNNDSLLALLSEIPRGKGLSQQDICDRLKLSQAGVAKKIRQKILEGKIRFSGYRTEINIIGREKQVPVYEQVEGRRKK